MNKITDAFGREATQGEASIWRTDDGIAIGPTDNEASVLSALSGMAPEGWTPPEGCTVVLESPAASTPEVNAKGVAK
jgi:hypothetical protein